MCRLLLRWVSHLALLSGLVLLYAACSEENAALGLAWGESRTTGILLCCPQR